MDIATGGKVTPIGAARPGSSGIKHRSSERFTLMLRVAKLVSSHGEYACVIRDVSVTGVRLRLFHDLPTERHLVLILANGESYFIENVWEHANETGREAGFRFSAPIDVTAFMTESSRFPKRPVRLAIELPATLGVREFSSPIVIRDLSQHGARIESERALFAGQHLRLKVDRLPQIFASVRWSSAGTYGVVFQNGFRLDELAQTIWTLRESAERTAAKLPAARDRLAPARPAIAATRRAG
ncbi:MAG: PilZ domain-containing protein [Novosphingobium sp.]